ncbi:MAG: hypothetical protein ACU84J_12385 [Gammaproteobacteria bacterium]
MMFRFVTRSFLLMLLVLPLASCKKTLSQEMLPAHIVLGERFYTQFVIRYEKGVHLTTNYRRGASIPINTPVQLSKITDKTIEVALENLNTQLVVNNVQKHTGDDIYQAFDKLFAKQRVNLSRFNKLERQHIRSGTVAKGMRKKAVIVAIGYPPITETPTLDSDTWVYWSGRFNRFNVNFRNGKVTHIKD